MKPFNLFITEINAGTTNAALTSHLDELFRAVMAHGRAGALNLKIKVQPATKGGNAVDKIFVVCDAQLSLPKAEQPSDMFFLTDDGEPTRKHPRQHELELRDVSAQVRGGAVDVTSKFIQPDADAGVTYKEVKQ